MSRDELVQDAERMEKVCCRLSGREDIWQDRYVYWIAVAIVHILTWILRRDSECSKQS